MRAEGFLCYAGVEVSNQARVATYVSNIGIPGATMGISCACPQLDEGFDTPLTDPAPWYEPTRPESADFLGFYASDIRVQPSMGRSVAARSGNGSQLGPMKAKGAIVQVAGLMLARSAEGMDYGEAWLAAALRGSPCGEGGCPGDDLIILPACPEEATYDSDRYFRTLVDVGLVDGPVFTPVISKENLTQQAAFILTSSQPWQYHPPTRCLDAEPIVGELGCALQTPEWMGEGTFRIQLENVGATEATNILVTGQLSLDGTCPVSGAGRSVPYSFEYTIPTLPAEDTIVIDGMRRTVQLTDASSKFATNGLAQLDFDGPFVQPDVGPCSTMCVTLSLDTGDVNATVDAMLREVK